MKTETHLEHALLTVRNLEQSREFYERLFPEWGVRWSGKTMLGNRWIHFGPPGDEQPGYLSLCEGPEAKSSSDEPYETVRIQHIGFAHANVAEVKERMARFGIFPSEETGDERFRRIYFLDPDGHELEIVQQL